MGIHTRPVIPGKRIADGPDNTAWFESSRPPSWCLVDLDTGEALGGVRQRGLKHPRYVWTAGVAQWPPREAGISLDLLDAIFEVNGSVEVPLKDEVEPPNPDYDPSKLPPEPLRRWATNPNVSK